MFELQKKLFGGGWVVGCLNVDPFSGSSLRFQNFTRVYQELREDPKFNNFEFETVTLTLFAGLL